MGARDVSKSRKTRTRWQHAAIMGGWATALVQLAQLIVSLLHS